MEREQSRRRYDPKFILSVTTLMILLASCADEDIATPGHQKTLDAYIEATRQGVLTQEARAATKTPTSTIPPSITPSPSPSPSPQPTETPTSTPSPTPDIKATNSAEIRQSLEGEELNLNNFAVQRVFILDLPLTERSLIFGLQTNEEGVTEVAVKNFDCEFKEAREQGLIGEELDANIGRLFESDIVLDQLTAERTGSYPNDVSVVTSHSFELNGESMTCEEQPLLQPAQEFVDSAVERIIEFIDRQADR